MTEEVKILRNALEKIEGAEGRFKNGDCEYDDKNVSDREFANGLSSCGSMASNALKEADKVKG